MSDDFANEVAAPRSRTGWLLTILLAAAAGLAFAWFLRELMIAEFPSQPYPSVGQPAPRLVVQGWVNGEGPTAEELSGQVYVVDAWAYWCGPCLDSMPHTVDLYHKYKDRGVLFVGLTGETAKTLDKSRKFIEKAQMPWPTGYGAAKTMSKFYRSDQMNVPTVWVVNRQGVIAWGGHPLQLTEKLLDQLLKEGA